MNIDKDLKGLIWKKENALCSGQSNSATVSATPNNLVRAIFSKRKTSACVQEND
jgi:hypothetical protein